MSSGRPLNSESSASVRSAREPFVLLDGLRGLAALMVLVYHAHDLFSVRQRFPSTYLAVDIFFMLSGFVLAFAYDERLADGMTWKQFMRVRLARLYPSYLVAFVIAVLGLTGALLAGSTIFASYGALGWSIVFGILLLPTPPLLSAQDALYPTNPAAWSIFYELLINFVFVIAFRQLRGRLLAAVIAVSGIGLGWIAASNMGVDAGAGWAAVPAGVARVFFSFFVGVLLYRGYATGRFRLPGPWWLPLGVMFLSFCIRFEGRTGVIYELFCIAVLYPALICMAATSKTTTTVRRLCLYGGAISYPVYIFHTPLLFLLTGVMVRVAHAPVEALRPWGGWFVVIVIVVLSALLCRWIEQPALVYFRQRAVARSSVPST